MGKIYRSTYYIARSHRHGCIHCLLCIQSCPRNVFGIVQLLWHKRIGIVKPDNCIGCGKCVEACPKGLFDLNK